MSKSTTIKAVVALALAVLLSWWLYERHRSAYEQAWTKQVPPERSEVFGRIQQSWQHNDFDTATQIALDSVRGVPSDDILYSTVSNIYFSRTQSDPTRNENKNEQWVKLAVRYAERALAANPSDLVNTYNLAQSYRAAGMNSQPPVSCEYYRDSAKAFEALASNEALRQQSGIIESEKVDFQLYRRKLSDQLNDLHQLMSHCSEIQVPNSNLGKNR